MANHILAWSAEDIKSDQGFGEHSFGGEAGTWHRPTCLMQAVEPHGIKSDRSDHLGSQFNLRRLRLFQMILRGKVKGSETVYDVNSNY